MWMYFFFLLSSGKPRLRQHLAEHAACVRGPWAGLSPELRETLHALCRPLPSHVPHPVHPPYAQQRLPRQRQGYAVPRSDCAHTHAHAHAQHPSQGRRILLYARGGLLHQRGHGARLSGVLRQTSDAQTAALTETQKQGDVTALTARGLASVAGETERMADIKEEEIFLPKVVRSVQKHTLHASLSPVITTVQVFCRAELKRI